MSPAAFVAREQQVAVLEAAQARAAAGQSAVVLVAGDAGAGKTRVVEELARRAAESGWLTLVGHCLELGGAALPYLPFTEVVATLRVREEPAVQAALASRRVLADLSGLDHGDPDEAGDVGRLQLFDAVDGLLGELARACGPLLLVLEDLHWADAGTRDLLRFLIARSRDERVLVVATVRSDDLHRRHPLRPLLAELVRHPRVERLEVPPFTEAELRRFLRTVAGDALSEAEVRDVLARSSGNAYFAEELVLYRGRGGALPETLTDVLLARVEALPPEVQQVVKVASAAGRPVGEMLLGAVDPVADLGAALREAVVRQVLVPGADDRYAFRHALLAEAVYADLLPGERTSLHRAYAAVLAEQGGSAAELARHTYAAHDLPAALSFSVQAAAEATRRQAPAEALRQLETALQLWSSVPDASERVGDLVDLTLDASVVAARAGELERAIGLAHAAVDLATDPVTEARARHRLAKQMLAGDQPGSSRETARSLQLLLGGAHLPTPADLPALDQLSEPGEVAGWDVRTDLVRAAATHARSCQDGNDFEGAAAWAGWALGAARRLDLGDQEASALTTLAAVAGDDPEVADELFRAARSKAREIGALGVELRSSYNLAANWFYAGRHDRALPDIADGLARAEEQGARWSIYAIELRVLQVLTCYQTGDWSGSAAAAELVRWQPPDLATLRLTAASLYTSVGRGEADAIARAERLRPSWSIDGQIALGGGGCLADALTWAGRPAEAVEVAEDARRHLTEAWSEFFLGGLWLAALALAAVADLPDEDVARAEGLFEVALTTAERGRPRHGVLGPEGRGWLARAHAEHARARRRPDPDLWQKAAEAFGSSYPYEVARCRWRRAEALLQLGDRDGATADAAFALEVAVRLGAAPLATAIRALATRGRLAVGGSAPGSGPLTPRESEVLAQVARGRTNRQVGEQLFISEKTVSVHLSNVMAKLGAGSRTEAVAIAGRRGLLPG